MQQRSWAKQSVHGKHRLTAKPPLHRQMAIACATVILAIFCLDATGAFLIPPIWSFLSARDGATLGPLEVSYAPEVWLSVLGVTLGTLVITISIAAQNIPKITELYMQDWLSQFYVWFLIGGSCHAVLVRIFADQGMPRNTSVLLNLYGLLPVAIVLAFPYVFYVLRAIQPVTVIQKICDRHLARLRQLEQASAHKDWQASDRQGVHQDLLESLNQLENLLEYLSFKEPQLHIVQGLSQLLQVFIRLKLRIDPRFFAVSEAVHEDISFQTMIDQFPLAQHRPTFYEQKVLRLIGNAYTRFLADDSFDLAALCGAELHRMGAVAMAIADRQVVELIIIRFNTMLRFALKHGANHNEARNLYTLLFHYRRFIEGLIRAGESTQAQACFRYLRRYGNEAYALGNRSPALYFIVDVFAAEMRSLLILVHQQQWPLAQQQALLAELLKVDSPPELDPLSSDLKHLNSGVRTLQISLALFYLEVGCHGFVESIIADLLEDRAVLGTATFLQTVDELCDRLQTAQADFWEDTDRGSTNLYYSHHTQQIAKFLDALKAQMNAER